MEIDVIIRKTVVYSGVTGFVLVVYLLLAGVSGLAHRAFGGARKPGRHGGGDLAGGGSVRAGEKLDPAPGGPTSFSAANGTREASVARVTETVMQSASLEAMTLDVAEEVQRCTAAAGRWRFWYAGPEATGSSPRPRWVCPTGRLGHCSVVVESRARVFRRR